MDLINVKHNQYNRFPQCAYTIALSNEGEISDSVVTQYATHCVCRLVLSAVQLMAVIEDVVVCGVETGLDTVPHNLAGSRWRL